MGLRSYRTELNATQKFVFDGLVFTVSASAAGFLMVMMTAPTIKYMYPTLALGVMFGIVVGGLACAFCYLPPSINKPPLRPHPVDSPHVEPEILPPQMKLVGESKPKAPAHQTFDDIMKKRLPPP